MSKKYGEELQSSYNDIQTQFDVIVESYDWEISPLSYKIALNLLTQVYEKYGREDSDTYRHYHNHLHTLGVIDRSLRLSQVLEKANVVTFSERDIELLIIAAAGHDVVIGSEGVEGTDETLSADIVLEAMGDHYTEEEKQTVREMIMTTVVSRDVNGAITQTHICSGTKDPKKYCLATADINGILIEGVDRMIEDVVNLYMEIHKDSHIQENPKGISEFLINQIKFIGTRIQHLDTDRIYYFGEENLDVLKKHFEDEFSSASRDAVSMAKALSSLPEMTHILVSGAVEHSTKVAVVGLQRIRALQSSLHEALTRTFRK